MPQKQDKPDKQEIVTPKSKRSKPKKKHNPGNLDKLQNGQGVHHASGMF